MRCFIQKDSVPLLSTPWLRSPSAAPCKYIGQRFRLSCFLALPLTHCRRLLLMLFPVVER